MAKTQTVKKVKVNKKDMKAVKLYLDKDLFRVVAHNAIDQDKTPDSLIIETLTRMYADKLTPKAE
jgi:hypothetical protein